MPLLSDTTPNLLQRRMNEASWRTPAQRPREAKEREREREGRNTPPPVFCIVSWKERDRERSKTMPAKDHLFGCIHLVTSLIRLRSNGGEHGLTNKEFGCAVLCTTLFALCTRNAPVRSAIPAALMLVMQVIKILRSYGAAKKPRNDAGVCIASAVIVGVMLHLALENYEGRDDFDGHAGDLDHHLP